MDLGHDIVSWRNYLAAGARDWWIFPVAFALSLEDGRVGRSLI